MPLTESGVRVVSQYGENLPFWGLPEESASMAKLSMKWKSMPSLIGTASNVTGIPVAPMYSIITFPSKTYKREDRTRLNLVKETLLQGQRKVIICYILGGDFSFCMGQNNFLFCVLR